MAKNYLIYGANGYTGKLTARLARERGHSPILAGRSAPGVAALAAELELPHKAFALDDRAALDAALGEVELVLHCAGPFAHTAHAMSEACLRTATHYLDVTGEIGVFEMLAGRDHAAREAGIMVMPGVGFDVVPSDCLANHLKRRLFSATWLKLGFMGLSRVSRGTATTVVENLHSGGMIRREGVLTPVPAAYKTRSIDFGIGPRKAATLPWGDLSTAFHSTGIANIEVYTAAPALMRAFLKVSPLLQPLLASSFVQSMLKKRIRSAAPGPSDPERERGKSFLWGQVGDDAGALAEARLRGPEGYTFTALCALTIIDRILAGEAPHGFQTPARAYGPDLVMEIDGVSREDIEG